MPKLQPVLLLLASVLSPFYLFIRVNGDARLVITSDAMDHEVGGRGLSFFHFCHHDVTKLKHFLGSTLSGCKYKVADAYARQLHAWLVGAHHMTHIDESLKLKLHFFSAYTPLCRACTAATYLLFNLEDVILG